MNKKSALALALLPLLVGGTAWADCAYPRAPTRIPDGTTSSKEEMLAAKKEVEQYNKDMEAYLSCIKVEHDEIVAKRGDELTEDQKKQLAAILTQKNDAAVDELQSVAARFNEQVRAFNKKDKGK